MLVVGWVFLVMKVERLDWCRVVGDGCFVLVSVGWLYIFGCWDVLMWCIVLVCSCVCVSLLGFV